MTVPATPRRTAPLAGDDVQVSFPFTFAAFSADDVRVVVLDETTSVETPAVLDVDYTVNLNADQDTSPGGTVIFLVAPTVDQQLTILGGTPYSQQTALPDGGAYRAENVERAFDMLSFQIQQLAEGVSRAAQVPVNGGDAAELNENIAVLVANIDTLNTIVANIALLLDLAAVSDDVILLAPVSTQIAALGAIVPQITAVATIAAQVVVVASIDDDVATVAAIAASVVAVANIAAAVTTVVANITPVQTVATNIAVVQAVAADIPNLATKVSKTSNTGSAIMPKGTTAQRDVAPATGYTRFNEDTDQLEVNKASGWAAVGAGASGGLNNPMFYENDQIMTEDYTIPAGKNASTTGPFSIASGKVLTVSTGVTLVVL